MTWSPVDLLAGSHTTVPVLGNPPEHCCRWVICLFRCCQASECVVLGASCKRCSSKGFAWICNAWIRHGPTSTQKKAAFLFCNFPASHIAQSLLLWGLAIAQKSRVAEAAILEGALMVSSEMSSGSHVAPSSSERVCQRAACCFEGMWAPWLNSLQMLGTAAVPDKG